MNNRQKIFNDPVYGFVSVPRGILLDLIDHRYFQRLRRIRQLGLTPYVYPGALHTRFHHALGALHLMQQAIETLRQKGVSITEEEAEAACIAILLHDIGHGPFSHALEHTLLEMHHEAISMAFMQQLNVVFDGRLTLAMEVFQDTYEKKFLHQLVSGQLDMDRMDYLNRDSFFTGVSEGVIGYDRIIKMLAVHEGQLVVEEKGIYSIEKFLLARRLMYWQVYLHKTSVSAEKMLIHALKRARMLALQGELPEAPRYLGWFLYRKPGENTDPTVLLEHFSKLDDNDITSAIKYWTESSDFTLAYLSKGLLDRKLFRLEWYNEVVTPEYTLEIRNNIHQQLGDAVDLDFVVFTGSESNRAYDDSKEQIKILFKNGQVVPIDQCSDVPLYTKLVTKYFIIYPKPLINMRAFTLLVSLFLSISTMTSAQEGPPNAQPGKCYAKCVLPNKFENVTEQVLVKAASKKITASKAVIENKTIDLVLKDASKKFIIIPAEYTTVTEQVMVKEPSKRLIPVQPVYETVDITKTDGDTATVVTRIVSVPAEYETATERVMIKAESKRFVEVPAVYETVTESYVLEPAYSKIDILQPQYETVVERLETKPAATEWVKKIADAACLGTNPEDCFVWCLVETPPEYQPITKRVNRGCDGSGLPDAGCVKKTDFPPKMGSIVVQKIKTPATIQEEVIPAEYKTLTIRKVKTPATTRIEIVPSSLPAGKKHTLKTPASIREEEIAAEYVTLSRQIVKTPASFREELIPPVYQTHNIQALKSPANTIEEVIPAEYVTITKRKLTKAGGFTAWKEVLCSDKIPEYTLQQVQVALNKAGYKVGTPDNRMGPATKAALEKFQKDKGLPVGNIGAETLKALGLIP